MSDDDWRRHAACADLPADEVELIFFGRGGSNGRLFPPEVRRARAICEGCPVLFDCLDDALRAPARHDSYGIRAGLTPKERATLRGPEEARPGWWADPWTGGDPQGERRTNRSA